MIKYIKEEALVSSTQDAYHYMDSGGKDQRIINLLIFWSLGRFLKVTPIKKYTSVFRCIYSHYPLKMEKQYFTRVKSHSKQQPPK